MYERLINAASQADDTRFQGLEDGITTFKSASRDLHGTIRAIHSGAMENIGTAEDTNSKTGNEKGSGIYIDKFDNRGGSATFGKKTPIDNSKVINPSPKEKEPWYKIAHPIIAIIVGLIAIFGFITGIRSCRDLSDKKPPSPPTTQLDTQK